MICRRSLSALSDIGDGQLACPHVVLVDDEVEAIKAMTADPEGTATVSDQPPGAGQSSRVCRMMLPAVGQAAGLARQQTREALSSWELSQLEETAMLLVSELVGNAVRHARSSASGLQLRLVASGNCRRIEVTDADPRPPQPRAPAGLDESGFGFVLVDALASSWGVDYAAAAGKTVWIELALSGNGKPECGP